MFVSYQTPTYFKINMGFSRLHDKMGKYLYLSYTHTDA